MLKRMYTKLNKLGKNVKLITEIELKTEDGQVTTQPVTVKEVNETSWEDICLVIWVIICILCSFGIALLIAVGLITIVTSKQSKVEEQLCEPLQRIPSGRSRMRNRLSNEDESGLLTIVNEGEEGGNPYTVLTMPCDSTLIDDFGNIWDLKGPWKLDCEEPREFQYLTERLPEHWTSCCSYPKVSSEYANASGYEGVGASGECWYCFGFQYWRARYKCEYTPVQLQKCQWVETGVELSVNGSIKEIMSNTLTVAPAIQAPYGFWRNGSSYIINTATNVYLENTNFNYRCKPNFIPTAAGLDVGFPHITTVSPSPRMVACVTLIKVPFKVSELGLQFCSALQVVLDTESGAMGLTSAENCSVKIEENRPAIGNDLTGHTYILQISEGTYRFLEGVSKIACVDKGGGMYVDCGANVSMVDVHAKEQGYDVAKEVVIKETQVADGSGWSLQVSDWFKDLGSNTKKLFTMIAVIIALIAVLAIVVLIIYCCCCTNNCRNNSAK
jgi:hypothetical protein